MLKVPEFRIEAGFSRNAYLLPEQSTFSYNRVAWECRAATLHDLDPFLIEAPPKFHNARVSFVDLCNRLSRSFENDDPFTGDYIKTGVWSNIVRDYLKNLFHVRVR